MVKLISYSPASGSVVGKTDISTRQDVDEAVKKAKQAFKNWRQSSFATRAGYVRKFRKLLLDNKEKIAMLTTLEMGKPIREACDDVTFELEFIGWYAQNAERVLGETVIREDDKAVYKTVYEPWGVCASIAPWNFPITMASTGITAQLLAGNTVIFKPSEYTTLTQKMFVDLFNQSGLPEGVLQCLVGAGEVGKMLVDSDIDLVWFTGSTAVGQEIYKKCANKFIKCLLELGGSSPAVVFADCDYTRTVDMVYLARFFNCGQVCSAVKRLFIEKSLYKKFTDALVNKLRTIKVGDPMKNVDMGPLVCRKQLETLISQVDDARKKGANVIIGGEQPGGLEFEKGNYYLPTILTNISKDMRVYKEEVFGPVLPIMTFDTEEEAVVLANDTPYGLTAEIFTKDIKKAYRVAAQVHAGGVSINSDVIYSPYCPIGGYKKSGLGREYGEEGLKELAQLKYICIAK
jgi:succinate-semialdehyde dehydrogenase/glutarate-semialdehyde dehydrogenase